jgi:hypothetical protein
MTAARGATAVACLVVASALAACGTVSPITSRAAAELSAAVQAVRSAALADHPSLAATDIRALKTKVAALENAGELSPARARAVLAAASTVQTQLELLVATTTTTATTATTATTTTTTTTQAAPGPRPGPPNPGNGQMPGKGGPGQQGNDN